MNTILNIAWKVGRTAPVSRSLRLSRHAARSESSISVYLLFLWAGCPHPAALRPASLGGLGTCLPRNVAASVSEWNLSSSLHHVATSVSKWMLESSIHHVATSVSEWRLESSVLRVATSVSEWNLSSSLLHVAASVSEWRLEFERRHDPQLFVGVTPVGGVPSPRILSK